MKQIQFKKAFSIEKPTTIKSERADLINCFLTRLNAERIGTKWKPLTARAVAVKVGHIPTEDLYFLLKQCGVFQDS